MIHKLRRGEEARGGSSGGGGGEGTGCFQRCPENEIAP